MFLKNRIQLEAPNKGAPVAVDFELKQLEADGTFIGLGAVFGNVDFHDDIIEREAFDTTVGNSNEVVILWQHNPTEPIGKGTVSVSFEGLMLHGRLSLGTSRGRDALALMRDGVTTGLSIGYDVIESDIDSDGIRHLHELRLWEISLVTFPANDQARVLQVKAVQPFGDLGLSDRTDGFDAKASEGLVRAWARAADGPNDDYRKAFLFHDEAQPEVFSSSHLPIATVIDGRLVAVPGAIEDAALIVNNGKDSDFSGADREKMKAVLTRYYRKMRVTFGDDAMRAPWEGQANMKEPGKSLSFDRILTRVISEASLTRVQVQAVMVTKDRDPDEKPIVSAADAVRLAAARDAIDLLLAEVAKDAGGGEESKVPGLVRYKMADDTKDAGWAFHEVESEDQKDADYEPPEGVVCVDCDTPLTKENVKHRYIETEDDIPVKELVCGECFEKSSAAASGEKDDSQDASGDDDASLGGDDDAGGGTDKSKDASGSEQGDDGNKSYEFDGEPLTDEDVSMLTSWASGKLDDERKSADADNDEIDDDLAAAMSAYADELSTE